MNNTKIVPNENRLKWCCRSCKRWSRESPTAHKGWLYCSESCVLKDTTIESDADYQAALAAVEALMDRDPEPGSADGMEIERLAVLIEEYEAKEEK